MEDPTPPPLGLEGYEAPMFPGAPPPGLTVLGSASASVSNGPTASSPNTDHAVVTSSPLSPQSQGLLQRQFSNRSLSREIPCGIGSAPPMYPVMEEDSSTIASAMFPETMSHQGEFKTRLGYLDSSNRQAVGDGRPKPPSSQHGLSIPAPLAAAPPQQGNYYNPEGSPSSARGRGYPYSPDSGGYRSPARQAPVHPGSVSGPIRPSPFGRLLAQQEQDYLDDATIESTEPVYINSPLTSPGRRNSGPMTSPRRRQSVELLDTPYLNYTLPVQQGQAPLPPSTYENMAPLPNVPPVPLGDMRRRRSFLSAITNEDMDMDRTEQEQYNQTPEYENGFAQEITTYRRRRQETEGRTRKPQDEPRKQILAEMKEACELRSRATTSSEVAFWDDQIKFLNDCILKLTTTVTLAKSAGSKVSSSRKTQMQGQIIPYRTGSSSVRSTRSMRSRSENGGSVKSTKSGRVKVKSPGDLPEGYTFKAKLGGKVILATVPKGGARKGEIFAVPLIRRGQAEGINAR